jgi:PhnB protein
MQTNPYLMFNGDCEAAFKFYEKCLGGRIVMKMTYGEAPEPDQSPKEVQDKIMHARLVAGDIVLMGSDAQPPRYQKPQGFSISILAETPAEAERVFQALSEGGNVGWEMEETFWAHRFGMVTDRFGIPWMVNCEKKMG